MPWWWAWLPAGGWDFGGEASAAEAAVKAARFRLKRRGRFRRFSSGMPERERSTTRLTEQQLPPARDRSEIMRRRRGFPNGATIERQLPVVLMFDSVKSLRRTRRRAAMAVGAQMRALVYFDFPAFDGSVRTLFVGAASPRDRRRVDPQLRTVESSTRMVTRIGIALHVGHHAVNAANRDDVVALLEVGNELLETRLPSSSAGRSIRK